MIERVWRLGKSTGIETVIATDDARLQAFAQHLGANVVMTSSHCLTGTDRVAEASYALDQHSIFFSLQADAVLTPPWVIQEVLQAMIKDPAIAIATPAVELTGEALQQFIADKQSGSSTGTTVVFDLQSNALYFSKALLPFCRKAAPIFRHIGLYAYRKDILQRLTHLPESPLEKAEKLEQLRALENGIPIRVVLVDYRGRTHGSVDRPEDVAFVEKIIAKEGELIL